MSLDVTYYSFNPTRSDKKLSSTEGQERLLHDLVKSEKQHLTWEQKEEVKKQINLELKDEFQLLYNRVKTRLEGTSLDYPWGSLNEILDFLTEEENVEYEAYSQKYRGLEEKLTKKIKPDSSSKKLVNKKSALELIREIDLEFGSVQNLYREDGVMSENKWLESLCISSLLQAFDIEKEMPNKEELISMYRNLDVEKFEVAAAKLSEEASLHVREATVVLRHFLEEIKPVVLDLSQNQNSLFYVDYGGSIDSFPDTVVKLLDSRARAIFKNFHEQNKL
jgi:hypothetical protein